IDKGGADRLALCFGVGDAGELFEKEGAGVAVDQWDVVVAEEEPHDLFGLALPQEAGVDEDAGHLVADRLVQEGGGDRRIDAAREAAHYTAGPHLLADAL